MAINDPVVATQIPAADYTIKQRWSQYTDDEHAVWLQLYARQIKTLARRAVPEFYQGLDALNLNVGGIPNFALLNRRLMDLTGWQVVTVPSLIPDDVFFEHLANRHFPAGRFIRSRDQMDYLQEPDIFHDVFGHVPLLTQPVFADYMQAYGKGGLRALKLGRLKNLARLYWYTVEFGLMKRGDDLKIYGAGIVSSQSESRFALESPSPNRLGFHLERLLRTDYIIDDFQQVYFVNDSFDQLFDATQQDFAALYKALDADEKVYSVTDILPADKVYTRGTQAYVKTGKGQAKVAS